MFENIPTHDYNVHDSFKKELRKNSTEKVMLRDGKYGLRHHLQIDMLQTDVLRIERRIVVMKSHNG